jgi:basic membrane protein A and related proteins
VPRWVALALLVAGNLALLGWGALRHGGDAAAPSGRLRVGLVLDVGGLGDKSFNDAAHRGLTRAAEELDVEVRFVEPGDGSDREAALRQLAAGGFDLVFGVGFIFTDDIRAAATRFPAVKFACIDYSVVPGQPPPPDNLVGLRFREEEGSFLVGALAAMVSTTRRLGFVGGMDIPLIHKFEAGYRAGVKEVCPTCEVYAAYAGTEPRAFADPTTGKELALAQYGRGADVIFHASGKTGAGVFNAARERGRLAIGVDSDQHHEAPCCVLTSMVKGVDVAVYETIRAVAAGEFRGGIVELGLAEDGVGYVDDERNARWITPEIRARLGELRRRVVAGEIVVPSS